MTDGNKDEDEKIDDDDDEKESSSSKPEKLKDTSHLHLGNSYAEKAIKGDNFPNDSSTCIHCPKCKNTFGSQIEFDLHIRKCNS